MNIDNGFDLAVVVVFYMSPHLRGLGPKSQFLMISFRLGEGETLPQFHLRALQERGYFFLLNDETMQK